MENRTAFPECIVVAVLMVAPGPLLRDHVEVLGGHLLGEVAAR